MWIVQVALRRPYTFIVLALLLLILGVLTIGRTAKDIFPKIGIPVVSVIWTYSGLPADEMSSRITGSFERVALATVNDIEHIESQSLNGVAVVKFFFHPGTNVDLSMSQLTAVSQAWLKQLPPGITPPLILAYNASSVPIIQLALSSRTIPEQGLFDLANNFVRTQLAGVAGASIPYPYGGKQRQIQIDLDQRLLQERGVSANDVVNAMNAQNLIIPAGTEKVGEFEYNVKLNGNPKSVEEYNDLPIKTVNGAIVYFHDVAHVRDGAAPQTNVVRVDGQPASLMTIQKTGDASTLDIIKEIKARLPMVRDASPPALEVNAIGDQSVFVSGAISGVIREGVIAAALTGMMILLFLGSWRSTLIITISIPLSVLSSIMMLSALGETINIMTLGGLALAVGILVDDATVAIESINTHLEKGEGVENAILNGAREIAVPAFVATLCICIVFVPMFFLNGVARYLFVPLAEAICFAMLASYVLSRTLVPTLAKYWLRMHEGHVQEHRSPNPFVRLQEGFQSRFEKLRHRYHDVLGKVLVRGKVFIPVFLGFVLASLLLVPWLGSDFFPAVDAGQIKLHVRGHAGLRVEETARLCEDVGAEVRKFIPGAEIASLVDNVGLPVSGINLSYSNSAPIGTSDADILVTLSSKHHPTDDYVKQLRLSLAKDFPGVMFAFLPSDMVTQILNFGLPAPIDIQVIGNNLDGNRVWASQLLQKIRYVSGTTDLRVQQPFDEPYLHLRIERTKAQELGFSGHDIAQNLLVSLSGSFQTSPTFWVDPKNGVSYSIATQTPQYYADSLQDLVNTPVTGSDPSAPPSLMASLVSTQRGAGMGVVSHYNVAPVIDIFGSVEGRDLGGVSRDLNKTIDSIRGQLPRGSRVVVRGQVQTMRSSYIGLLLGLAFAIMLDYLLIVVNFQSWLDPFIMISALPAALAGIAWFLFITHTTLSVPALMGTIMCMGVATANSILVVSFATEQMTAGKDAVAAALEAGYTRFRPVLMTALAMIIGMVPMAMGMGDGGEQNAPLGRAVIGGLLFATVSTLFFVPTFFSVLHGSPRKRDQLKGQPLNEGIGE